MIPEEQICDGRKHIQRAVSLLFQVSEMSCVSSKQDTVLMHKWLGLSAGSVYFYFGHKILTVYCSSRSELKAAEAVAVGLSKLAPSFNLTGNSIQFTHTSRRLLTPYASGVCISLETVNTHTHINTHSCSRGQAAVASEPFD